MSGLLAGAAYALILRLELAVGRWRLLREGVAVLELRLEESLLRIRDNLDTLLDRVKNEAETLEKAQHYPGRACVVLGKGGTAKVVYIEDKYKEMLENIQWQQREGLKLMTVQEFELIIRLTQLDVIGGDWCMAVSLLNWNRVA